MLGLDLSEDIPNFTNYGISEINIRCDICIRKMWHYMSKKNDPLKELHFLVRALNKPDISPREEIFGVCKKNYNKIDRFLLHNNRFKNCIIWK